MYQSISLISIYLFVKIEACKGGGEHPLGVHSIYSLLDFILKWLSKIVKRCPNIHVHFAPSPSGKTLCTPLCLSIIYQFVHPNLSINTGREGTMDCLLHKSPKFYGLTTLGTFIEFQMVCSLSVQTF